MSTAKFDTLQNAAGSKSVPVATVVDGSAKAWVNFNGTGTPAVRASFNCSGITDFGVGDYRINFTTAMADANYAVSASMAALNGTNIRAIAGGPNYSQTVSGCRIQTWSNGGVQDSEFVSVAIFR